MGNSEWWNPDQVQGHHGSGEPDQQLQTSLIDTHHQPMKRMNPLIIVSVVIVGLLVLACGVLVAATMASSGEVVQPQVPSEPDRSTRVDREAAGDQPHRPDDTPDTTTADEVISKKRRSSEASSPALPIPQWDRVVQESAALNVTGGTDSLSSPDTNSRLGVRIPRIAGQSFDGSPIVIDPENGRNKIVVVITHWSSHAQVDVKGLDTWLGDNHLPENTDFILISSSLRRDEANFPPSLWLAGLNWSTPVLVDDDDSSAAIALGVHSLPAYFFVSDEGIVEEQLSGSIDIQTFEDTLELIFR